MKLSFRQIRIIVLLGVLGYVAGDQYLTEKRTTSWQDTLQVVIYPINGDGSSASEQAIGKLTVSRFDSVKQFILEESQRYGVTLATPVDIRLASKVENKPPKLPALDSNVLQIMWWSLRMRWWAWREDTDTAGKDIRLFVEYYADETTDSHVSVGLQKGMLSLIKNYTGDDYIERNNVIIAHEMLHTLGATDKYDPFTLLPIFPYGYAMPEKGQLGQRQAEIMGGRIPTPSGLAIVPKSLDWCLVGEKTAKEIGWLNASKRFQTAQSGVTSATY